MNLYKIIKYIAFALGISGSILAMLIIASDSEGWIDNILYVTYVILVVILTLILIYVVKGVLSGDIKKTLITLGLFSAVIVISYLMSSGTDLNLEKFNEKGLGITEGISKNVGAGLYAFYILAVVAIGATFVSSVKKLLNNK
jgi:uncharacterized MnhB-related membrane protein